MEVTFIELCLSIELAKKKNSCRFSIMSYRKPAQTSLANPVSGVGLDALVYLILWNLCNLVMPGIRIYTEEMKD